jgi:hypothetical protein
MYAPVFACFAGEGRGIVYGKKTTSLYILQRACYDKTGL